jgi:hypothetical protein
LRFSHYFHPLERSKGNPIRVCGDGKGCNPTINADWYRMTGTPAPLHLMQLGSNAVERYDPASRSFSERRGEDVKTSSLDHSAYFSSGAENFDITDLWNSQTTVVIESNGMFRGKLPRRHMVSYSETRNYFALALEPGEAHFRPLPITST